MNLSLRDYIQKITAGSRLPSRARYLIGAVFLSRLIPRSGLVEGYVGSYRMMFDLADHIQRDIYLGLYDPVETRLVNKLLKPGDIVYDVGANVGYYSLLASELVGGGVSTPLSL